MHSCLCDLDVGSGFPLQPLFVPFGDFEFVVAVFVDSELGTMTVGLVIAKRCGE